MKTKKKKKNDHFLFNIETVSITILHTHINPSLNGKSFFFFTMCSLFIFQLPNGIYFKTFMGGSIVNHTHFFFLFGDFFLLKNIILHFDDINASIDSIFFFFFMLTWRRDERTYYIIKYTTTSNIRHWNSSSSSSSWYVYHKL